MKKKRQKHRDYVGEKIGMLHIKEFKNENKKMYYYCICDCGNEKWMRSDGIINSGHRSCGCVSGNFKHGMSNTRIFNIWTSMKQRCFNKRLEGYHYYGGRGITVCEEWTDKETGFINFYEWTINNGYDDTLTLDRIDSDGNYEPTNCRWSTNLEQMNNIRSNHIIEIDGVKKTASEWARESGISRVTIKKRALKNNTKDEIFKEPHKAEFQSGVKGVKWDKYKQRWKVETPRIDGKRKHLGYFRDLNKAIEVRNTYDNNSNNSDMDDVEDE